MKGLQREPIKNEIKDGAKCWTLSLSTHDLIDIYWKNLNYKNKFVISKTCSRDEFAYNGGTLPIDTYVGQNVDKL